ncbi:ATP-dependent helicase [Paramyrothecium foliicola]|nr:ATP-dependent helicase [Paramyrothecium foliicola]
MLSHRERRKPGAIFSFKPRDNIASLEEPTFSEKTIVGTQSGQQDRHERLPNVTAIMVTERAPPKAPLQSISPNEDAAKREKSPESDSDVTELLRGWSSIKSSARQGFAEPPPRSDSSSSSLAGRPLSSGHPPKMISSRKQKAGGGIFIKQRTHPEFHLDTRVTGPRPPTYQDRRPPPMPTYSSMPTHSSIASVASTARHNDEVFYTDPAKANADLKALLEGGMEEDDEEAAPTKETTDADAGTAPVKAENDPKDGTVEGLKVKLLPHQVEGVQWMRGRELGPVKRGKVPKGGLLADDMGLGKTLQTVSLILTNQKPPKDSPKWKKQFETMNKTTLVVAPLALIRQWEHEIKDKVEKSHGLKVLVHHGPQRTKSFKELALYDVVITTYQILVSEHGASSDAADGLKAGCFGLHWWRVVLDEAHTIKNRNAKATKACYALRSEYRWCLSGTPMQNSLDELQSLVKFLRIKPYDDLKEWKEQIDKPLKAGKGHVAIRRLHSLLRCFMKRRTKEILKEAGALNPGGKPSAEGEVSTTGFKVTERKVVTVAAELSAAERRFYDRLEARADRSMEMMMTNKVNYASAFTLLLRLRQTCNHPKLVEGKLEKDRDAFSTDTGRKPQDLNVDAMADMFAGMGITEKSCGICGRTLGREQTSKGAETCSDCEADLREFNGQGKVAKTPKKKSKVKKVERETQIETTPQPAKAARRPRNRNAIIDSDDEDDEEGSWLVPENERGHLKLGKAGGDEDENAEGGGDWIGSDDSDEDTTNQDQSNLSSFIVNDEVAKREPGYKSADEAGDDDSLLSISALTKQLASQTLNDPAEEEPSQVSTAVSDGTEEESSQFSDASDLESGSEDADSELDADLERAPRLGAASRVAASSKIRELIKILRREVREHKFIVFSQFTSMLDLVEPFLSEEGLAYTRYDGSMKNDAREESLRSLREDRDTRILLCSLKCGSLGLNLTAATRVVILEPFWNPFVEEQAIDRVHRLTQTVDVVIYKLTVTNTVEERIIALQDKKRELAEQTIEGGARKAALKLGLNEIIDLFKPGYNGGAGAEDGAADRSIVSVSSTSSRRSPREDRPGRERRKMGVPREESSVYGRRW